MSKDLILMILASRLLQFLIGWTWWDEQLCPLFRTRVGMGAVQW